MHEVCPSQSCTKDVRGRAVRLLDPVSLHVLHRYDVIDADTLHEMVEEIEPGTARYRRYAIILVPCSILLLAIGITALYYFSDVGMRADLLSTLMNPAIMVPTIVGCLLPWITARQARMKRVRSVMLRHLRCPHCGYDLRGTPTDPNDGTTTCAECGCTWLLTEGVVTNDVAAAQHSMQAHSKKVLLAVAVGLTAMALVGLLVVMIKL